MGGIQNIQADRTIDRFTNNRASTYALGAVGGLGAGVITAAVTSAMKVRGPAQVTAAGVVGALTMAMFIGLSGLSQDKQADLIFNRYFDDNDEYKKQDTNEDKAVYFNKAFDQQKVRNEDRDGMADLIFERLNDADQGLPAEQQSSIKNLMKNEHEASLADEIYEAHYGEDSRFDKRQRPEAIAKHLNRTLSWAEVPLYLKKAVATEILKKIEFIQSEQTQQVLAELDKLLAIEARPSTREFSESVRETEGYDEMTLVETADTIVAALKKEKLDVDKETVETYADRAIRDSRHVDRNDRDDVFDMVLDQFDFETEETNNSESSTDVDKKQASTSSTLPWVGKSDEELTPELLLAKAVYEAHQERQ